MTGPLCIYGEVPRGPRAGPGGSCRPRWRTLLPPAWAAQAVEPESFRIDREYEVPARRILGLDRGGTPCFCAYDYRLIALRSDDDEELYGAIVFEETVKAWRLADGRWLVHRSQRPFGEEGEEIREYALAERMPR